MNCYFHEVTIAVGSCQGCGKALCKACAGRHTPCMCEECFAEKRARLELDKKQKKKDALIDTHTEFIATILKGLACAIGLTLFFRSTGDVANGGELTLGIIFFFIPFGWSVITYVEQWLPDFFMSGLVWLFYLTAKVVFSVLLGIPCFLYQTAKYIFRLVKRFKS